MIRKCIVNLNVNLLHHLTSALQHKNKLRLYSKYSYFGYALHKKKVCIESKSVYGYIVIHNIKLVLMCLIGRALIIRRW